MVYVSSAASGQGTGSSWADAYTSLQNALQNTSAGQLWVAAGTYSPGPNPTDTFELKNGVAVYGGFVGNEIGLNGRNPQVNLTILDGKVVNYHVLASEDNDATAVLDGFTIQGGKGQEGGGLLVSGGSPTLRTLVFANNAALRGGGVYNAGGDPTLDTVTFMANEAVYGDGGGFYNDGGSPVFINVSFGSATLALPGNATKGDGGGMYSSGGNPSLSSVAFYQNTADLMGGGLYVAAGNPTLDEVTFSNNYGQQGGGGLYNSSGTLQITGGSFDDNNVGTGASGGGVYNDSGTLTLVGTLLENNSAEANGGGLYNASGSVTLQENFSFNNNTAANSGGGLYNSSGSIAAASGGFSANVATASGGGVYTAGSGSPAFTDVLFSENEASTGSGGGLYAQNNATVTVEGTRFIGNKAQLSGGGAYAGGSGSLILENVTLKNNQTLAGSGGGIFNSGKLLAIQGTVGSVFETNTATSDGGGLYTENTSENTLVTLLNVSFNANSATGDGGGLYARGASIVYLDVASFTNNRAASGGGLYNIGNTLQFKGDTLVTFSGNGASSSGQASGGGLYHENADAILSNIAFRSNSAGAGGGAYVTHAGSLGLTDVSFESNSATMNGGALGVYESNLRFDRGYIANNGAAYGAGLFVTGDACDVSTRLSNVAFVTNTATVFGGALAIPCSFDLVNTTIVGNRSSGTGGGIWLENSPDVGYILLNSILWGNEDSSGSSQAAQVKIFSTTNGTLIFKNNLIQGGFNPAQQGFVGESVVDGVLSADPEFACAPGNTSCSAVSLELQRGSPAVDVGNNAFLPSEVPLDLAGNPRIVNSVVDLGAYEFQGSAAATAFEEAR